MQNSSEHREGIRQGHGGQDLQEIQVCGMRKRKSGLRASATGRERVRPTGRGGEVGWGEGVDLARYQIDGG